MNNLESYFVLKKIVFIFTEILSMTKSKRNRKAVEEEYIHHEPVESPKSEPRPQVVEAEVIDDAKVLELTIQREIARFNLADAGIEVLKKQYSDLTIKNVDDKEGYKVVRDAWTQVRSARTALEKKGLEIRGGYNQITKAVSKEEDRLVDLIKPLEDSLHKKWKAIDDEKERIKKEQAEAEEKRLRDRLEKLLASGMTLKDGYYQIGETVAVDVATLRTMTDEQYEKLHAAVVKKAEELAEAKRLQEAEDKKKRDELEADRQRLQLEQEDFEKKKRDLEEAQASIKKSQEQMANNRREFRLDMLEAIGMTISGDGKAVEYHNGIAGVSVTLERVLGEPDAEFSTLLKELRKNVDDCKDKLQEHLKKEEAEKKALEEKKIFVSDCMVLAGMTYNRGKEAYRFGNDFFAIEYLENTLVEMTSDELHDLTKDLASKIEDAKKKQEKKKQQEEDERERLREEQQGDIFNLNEYFLRLRAVKRPTLKSAEVETKLAEFRAEMDSLIKRYWPAEEVAEV